MSKITVVRTFPRCDFHSAREAEYDAKTIQGPWANLCGPCYIRFGVGLGTGKGQRLVLESEESVHTREAGWLERCRWFALCESETDRALPHPILGPTPCCIRCADQVGMAQALIPNPGTTVRQ